MKLVVIGVNHKTAPVALREQLAFTHELLPDALEQLKRRTDGCAVLSTCNRTEIYALLAGDDVKQLKQWLADFQQLCLQQIDPYLYVYQDVHALTHWVRVAAGLDSMILGEPQILGQIKQAIAQSQAQNGISSKFGWVIDQVFAAAKQVRHDTQVGAHAVSLGFAAAKLVTQIFDTPEQLTLLVVAAGEMNRLVATHIAGLGVGRIIICNRSPERAHRLAAELQQPRRHIEVHALSDLPRLLSQADVVTSCSGSMDMLINKAMTRQALKQRRYQPMLLVDLAVPRDIDPKAASLDEVFLYSIDDLQHVIAGNMQQRRQAAVDAELLVSQLVMEIERRFAVRQVGADIQYYRQHSEQLAEQLLAASLLELQQGDKPAEAIITELSRRLTQTLTHAPSTLLRKAARQGDDDLLGFVVEGLQDAYRRQSSG